METPNVKFSAQDARESYEMLRASHTLLRTAYGMCAMLNPVKDKKEAKEFQERFQFCFRTIANCAERFLKMSDEEDKDSSSQSDK